MGLTYDFIMEAVDEVIGSFEQNTPLGNFVCRKKLSPVSTEDNKVYLYIENEIETLLDGFNVQNNVEVITEEYPGVEGGALCVSFFYEGNLGTYNIFIHE